ncbi:hypothetical protein GOP47_0006975 [Adiantum capillus-veneris]|uniref:FLZ-type domain-containing protein n=1 Tax=Adiantum capillus-veneris TaxID=13818 RepID=A0A9D4V0D3_ADICA|nr:hypothetical protein GOP47_0006975 [Adiantum capillus-veneris]
MGSTCAGVQSTMPRSRFVKPYVEAPRQVIGFDLSPKGGKSEAVLIPADTDDDDVCRIDPSAVIHSNCMNSCSISSKTATHKGKSTTVTSPRSALQQLLLPPLLQSEPAAKACGLSHGPLLPAPICKSQLEAKQTSLRSRVPTSIGKPCAMVECDPVPAAHLNWPIFRGIAELVTPSRHATSINDGKNGNSSTVAVSAIKCWAEDGKKSCGHTEETIHELPRSSQRDGEQSNWSFEEPSPFRERCKSIWMKEVMISSEHPKSTGIEITWKQANMNMPEKSKKSSLFVLSASSPTIEYSKHYHLHGTIENSSRNMDMQFLDSCYLCKRLLGQGHDVFMYSGDKAFCSMECRYQQIVIDERKDRHDAPSVIRSGASPVYQSYNMASAGAAAITTSVASATTHHPITISRPNFMNPAAAA